MLVKFVVNGKMTSHFPTEIEDRMRELKRVIVLVNLVEEYCTDHALLAGVPVVKFFLYNRSAFDDQLPECFGQYDVVACYDGPGWFDTDTGNTKWVENPENEEIAPEVCAAVAELLEQWVLPVVPAGNVHLTTTSEELVVQQAFWNRKYNLCGMRPDLAGYFVSKALMIEKCNEIGRYGVRYSKFSIDRSKPGIDTARKLLEEPETPPFPIFVKPEAGSAAIHARKIDNIEILTELIDYAISFDDYFIKDFVAQEYISGTMYNVHTIVTGDGKMTLVAISMVVNTWHQIVADMIPVGNAYLTPELPEYGRLWNVAFDILTEFGAPKNPALYVIEIMKSDSSHHSDDPYRLVEIFCRPNAGTSENWLTQMITGLDPDGLHIAAPFLNQQDVLEMKKSNGTAFSVWYPRKPGVVLKNNPIPPSILSDATTLLSTTYHHDEGDVTSAPFINHDISCNILGKADDFDAAIACVKRLIQFEPVTFGPLKRDKDTEAVDAAIHAKL